MSSLYLLLFVIYYLLFIIYCLFTFQKALKKKKERILELRVQQKIDKRIEVLKKNSNTKYEYQPPTNSR